MIDGAPRWTARIYFLGPMSMWNRQPAVGEVIANVSSRWRWLCVVRIRAIADSLLADRTGWQVMNAAGDIVEWVEGGKSHPSLSQQQSGAE